ncbi:MAG: hypothetical protein CME68_10290 [Halobacteriovoraceae bacterium]|nr:hypothetical protein [Halobacteriovoraceae bacterium]|tara:strand:+ start:2469 stop:4115 length:1647 start_codon:yes stop_codon:yes gene_type:complete
MEFKLPLEQFYHWEKETPYKTYLRQPHRGRWKDLMWIEVSKQVRSMASFLMVQDLPSRSNIAICSKNSAYWVMADLAIWLSGHISVPIFPNISPTTLEILLEHSEVQMIFIEKGKDWEKMKAVFPKDLKKVFLPPHQDKMDLSWEKICSEYRPFNQNIKREGSEIATIIYTSGTTGQPKGVMHTFDSFSYAAKNVLEIINLEGEQHFFSYLPLAHVAERALIEVGSLYINASISFLENKATFPENLRKVQPTIFLAVPFIWESIQTKILQKLPQNRLSFLLKIPLLSDFIKKRLKKKIGFSRVQFAITGAAPINKELLEWYQNLGISIIECYGMTENLTYSHGNLEAPEYFGTVGKPYPHVEVQLASDGEILVKSPCNFKGYFKDPERTLNDLQGSFFKTGDLGETDEEGRLKIIGRKKDIFKTTKGKFISPKNIETPFLKSPLIKQVCVVGNGLSGPIALVVLEEIEHRLPTESIKKELFALKESINQNLQNHEQIEKVIIMKDEWNDENGLLTPTLKLKRTQIENKFKKLFDKWLKDKKEVLYEVD